MCIVALCKNQRKEGFMSKKELVNQHIVPRIYLKRFACSRENPGMIGVRLNNTEHYIQKIDNVGYIKNYYDVTDKEDPKHWERFFSKEIEPLYGMRLNNILSSVLLSSGNTSIITDDDIEVLSKIIISQFLRVPAFIDNQIERMPDFVEGFKWNFIIKNYEKLTKSQVDIVKKITFTNEQIKGMILSYINNPVQQNKYMEIMKKHPWVAFYNSISDYFPFITSDNPIVMTNLISKSFDRSDNGIGNENTIIYFPVSPSILIAAFPERFSETLKNHSRKKLILNQNDIGFISKINTIIMSQCYKQSFLPLSFYDEIFSPKIEYGFLPEYYYGSKTVYENILCELLNKSEYFAEGEFVLINKQSNGEPDVINRETGFPLDFKLMISQSFSELQKIIKKSDGNISLKKKPEVVLLLNACRNMNPVKLKEYSKRNDMLSKAVSHFFEKNLNISKNIVLFVPLLITTVDKTFLKDEQFELIHNELSQTLQYIYTYRNNYQSNFDTYFVYIVNIHGTTSFTFVISKFTEQGLEIIDKVNMFSLESILDLSVENIGDDEIKESYKNYKSRKIKL